MDFTQFQGIGAKKDKLLHKMGLHSLEDVWLDFPVRYVDRRKVMTIAECNDEMPVVIEATVLNVKKKAMKFKRSQMVICEVQSHMYHGEIIFFTSYVFNKLIVGNAYYFFGKLTRQGIFFKMQHPEFSEASDRRFLRIQPIYRLTAGLTQIDMLKLHEGALMRLDSSHTGPLPPFVEHMARVVDRVAAIRQMHFPTDEKGLKVARYRFIYEELFMLQLKLVLLKRHYHSSETHLLPSTRDIDDFIAQLPFELTEGQRKAVEAIRTDLVSGYAMNRLIQGDVGSGKTIVALIAMRIAANNGSQSVLMAPTTVLAEQHFQSLKEYFGETYKAVLLTSNMTAKTKREIKESIAEGHIQMIVGTQAIIQEDVDFKNLALVITDEQHRFGVRQRFFATQKGMHPHTLVMSATPIPRTLSMILYGDMNVSQIKEMPVGRKPIKTHFVSEKKKAALYGFVDDSIEAGRQAYFVCPLVETNEQLDLTSVEALYEALAARFSNRQIGVIHGRMKADEKDDVMHRFKDGELDILVSTTVIEVGVNVPNATVMVIVDAERFGLSQLHQLRGRVGRGAEQAYCFMMSSKMSKDAKKRIETMINTNDGFQIAEMDLAMRGPGEMFGLRQHGLPELRVADLVKHQKTLEVVQEHIRTLMSEYVMGNKEVVKYFDALGEMLNEEAVL
ncbi:ATP-dependent DNA helicase RecG [Fusibacter paucivorans]|uniref:ATP-dependent DNA helicase RecG n=1 Tax=Fusibacter paucivorans TaxID=76009 RepID=A0ABS5PQM7_9FIRM|nr:ATP-dependent DNA helicase RecG [Fusibacter paucivorans]MBS7527453.1 ATP-dependent DNA helicase RecG [Fusibacter paucivorans]